ncbi:uncharacterized protein LOC118199303 isoform X2 [Stegodyphus dumicola]|uniref:uncharacterized protein LOC118199303 isoform X2 n=1 Tax=Stegodyphus dumicola TaxID=202533 RepID=UPI0015AFA2FF|nr:uncharacterized protein LOC118199303 isoform X2 [Stegodyphus dumicola]
MCFQGACTKLNADLKDMGYLFPCNEKLTSSNMEAKENPNKKIRLDLPDKSGNLANDDLWGQDDITADEFDLLESQATQTHSKASCNLNSYQCHEIHKSFDSNKNELENVKLQQYELEGRIKLLSQTLEKTSKALQDERLNRDKIVAEKLEECHKREKVLQNEIEKMQSILQFKEQEMKSVYNKAHVLESHVEEKYCNQPEMPSKFLERFQFQNIPCKTRVTRHQRKYKLQVETPRGDTQGIDIMSSILCNRLNLVQHPYTIPAISNHFFDSFVCMNISLSAVSMVRLKSEQEIEDLLEYYESILKAYVTELQNCDLKSKLAKCGKMSPLSLRKTDLDQKKVSVISCLRDLTYLLSCSQSSFSSQNLSTKFHFENEETVVQDTENVPCSSLFAEETKINSLENSTHLLLKTIIALANPDTYPVSLLEV